MKICQVINSLSSGGAEVFTAQLAVALRKKGHEVILLSYQGPIDHKGKILNDYLLGNGVSVRHMKGFRKGYWGYLRAFFFLFWNLIKIAPNVIHAHLQMSDFFVSLITRFLLIKKPTLVRTVHNKRKAAKLNHFFEKMMFQIYDYNIACSDFVMNNYENLELRRFLVSVPNGIDLAESEKHVVLDKLTLRKELGLPLDKKIFFNIGSMYLSDNRVSKKNQNFIIDAVEELKHRDDIYFLLIGDGTIRVDLEESVSKKELANMIKFTGNVLNVYKYIIASDFCVMPSLDEGLPIALIESVCSGKYAITSPIDAFLPFKSSSVLILESFCLKKFCEHLEYTAENHEKLNSLALSNVEYFKGLFDINNVADRYLEFYNK